ncbi:hypothetical protein PLIIFM63780_002371 [Purpureocillium lilacinum]|nr:hypothetical protein PLIIFM63780_002371 [Purpureocillium lilacinum]
MKLSGAIWACLTAFGVVDFVAASDSDHPKFKDQWSALKYADKLNRGVRPGCKESGGKCFSRGGKGKVFCDPAEVMAAVAMAELASDEWQNS